MFIFVNAGQYLCLIRLFSRNKLFENKGKNNDLINMKEKKDGQSSGNQSKFLTQFQLYFSVLRFSKLFFPVEYFLLNCVNFLQYILQPLPKSEPCRCEYVAWTFESRCMLVPACQSCDPLATKPRMKAASSTVSVGTVPAHPMDGCVWLLTPTILTHYYTLKTQNRQRQEQTRRRQK